jgi:hypothetical protein
VTRRVVGLLLLGAFALAGVAAAVALMQSNSAAQAGCTFFWTGAVGPSWGSPGNWSRTDGGPSAMRMPGPSDVVCMSTAPATTAATAINSPDVMAIEWGQTGSVSPSLTIEGGTLTVGSGSQPPSSQIADLTVAHATVSGTSPLAVSTLSLMGTATLSGPGSLTITAGGSGTIGSPSASTTTLTGGYSLVNQGTLSVLTPSGGTTTVALAGGSTLVNDATLDVGDRTALVAQDAAGDALDNQSTGVLAYTGSTVASVSVPFANAGTATAAGTGTLHLGATPSGTDAGSYQAGSGATIEFDQSRTLSAASTWTGSGTLGVAQGATLTALGTPSVGGLAVVDATLVGSVSVWGSVELDSATLDGGGTMTVGINAVGTLASGGGPPITLSGGYNLVNNGTLAAAANGATALQLDGGATVQNGGTLELAAYTAISAGDASAVSLVNQASGTVSYSGSTSGNITVPFSNAGTVRATGPGPLRLGPPGSSPDTGIFSVGSGGTLELQQSRTLSAATWNGSGTLRIDANVTFTDATALTLGGLYMVGGTYVGSATVTGSLVLRSATVSGGPLTLGPSASGVIGTGTVQSVVTLAGGASLDNEGALTFTDSSSLAAPSSPTSTLVNESSGTVAYAGSSGANASIKVPFANAGAVSTTGAGTLVVGASAAGPDAGTYGATAGSTVDFGQSRTLSATSGWAGAGTLAVTGGATLTVDPTLTVGGLTVLGGTFSGTVTATGTIDLQAATLTQTSLTLAAGGSGTLDQSGGVGETLVGSSLVNDGTLTTTTDPTGTYSDLIALDGSSSIRNDGVMALTDGALVETADPSTDSLVDDPGGTLGYSGTGSADVELPFTNNGSVDTSGSGTLNLYQGGSTPDSGSFTAGAGSTVEFKRMRTLGASASWAGAGTLAVGSGTLTAVPSLAVSSFALDGGTFAGSAVVSGTLSLAYGTLEGPGTITLGTSGTGTLGSAVPVGVNLDGGYALVNRGQLITTTVPMVSTTFVVLGGGSSIENAGSLTLTDSAAVVATDNAGDTVVNDPSATITYAGSAVASVLAPFTNNGDVDVNGTGTLEVGGGGAAADTGAYAVATNATLDVVGTRTLGAAGSFTGAGSLEIGSGGDLSSVPSLTPTGLSLTGGTLSASATVGSVLQLASGTLSGATVTVPATATATLGGGSGSVDLVGGASLVNNGAMTTAPGTVVSFAGASKLRNAGTLSVADGTTMSAADATGDLVTNVGGGSITYSGTAKAVVVAPFLNQGAVSLTGTGTLTIGRGPGTADTGSYSATAGATIRIAGARSLGAGASLSGGTLRISPTGAIVTTPALHPANFYIWGGRFTGSATASGVLSLGKATLTGPGSVKLAAGGSGSLKGTLTLAGGETLLNDGTLTTFSAKPPLGATMVDLTGSSTIENGSQLTLTSGTGVSNGDGSADQVVNDAGATITYVGQSTSTIGVPFTNNGTLTLPGSGILDVTSLTNLAAGTLSGGAYVAGSGHLELPGPVTTNAATLSIGTRGRITSGSLSAIEGMTSNQGTLSLAQPKIITTPLTNAGAVAVSAGTLQVQTYTQTGGTTTLGAGAVLEAGKGGTGIIELRAGTVTGNGTLVGEVYGGATIQPGSAAGPLAITGHYGPGSLGTLAIGVSGPPGPSGTDFGQLAVSGTAVLRGTLALTTAPGFTPTVGATYPILSAGSVTGTFSKVTGAALAGGHSYSVTYTSTGVELTVQ